MDIAALAAAAQGQAKSEAAQTSLATNFDTFLTLLTTQLQNQDPLEPLKSNEFTQQLVQFSGVEQQIAMNQNLETLITATALNNANFAVNYLGKEVEAIGNAAELANAEATWSYTLSDDAPDTSFLVIDQTGRTVFTATESLDKGTGTFTWDGKDNNGVAQPDGTYFLKIVANDADGNPVGATPMTQGIVTAVDMTSTDPLLKIGGALVRFSEVLAVREAPAPDPGT